MAPWASWPTVRPWGTTTETNRVYVTSQESRTLSVIDGATGTVVSDIDLRTRACGVATNPRTNRIYVTSLDASAVTVVDGASLSVVDTLLTPSTVCGVAVNAQTNRVYVSTQETGSVSVLDPQAGSRAVIETRSLFGTTRATEVLPNDIDVNPQGDGVYVVNKTSRSLVTATGDLAPS